MTCKRCDGAERIPRDMSGEFSGEIDCPDCKDTTKCDACQEVFEKGWTDKEAMAEARELYPPEDMEDMAVICDPCFQKMMSKIQVL